MVVVLYDAFGASVCESKRMGYRAKCYSPPGVDTSGCVCLEETHELPPAPSQEQLLEIVRGAAFVLAVPTCRHICISGARWWKRKRREDPEFQSREVASIITLFRTLRQSRCPFAMLMPQTPLLRVIDQHSPVLVSPHEFGGYLNEGSNPVNVDIPSQDAYKKRTSLFLGNHAVMPIRRPVKPNLEEIKTKSGTKLVSPLFKSRKSRVLRGVPPRGLCSALARANLVNLAG